MALTKVEDQAQSLMTQGGMQEPATAGPDEVQVAGVVSNVASRLSRKVTPMIEDVLGGLAADVTGKTGRHLDQARQDALKILEEKRLAEEVPAGERAAGEVPAEEPVIAEPAVGEPAPEEFVDAVDPSLPPTPERFIRDDPWDDYIKVGDDEIDFVMQAPRNRDALLGEGMTDFNASKIPDEGGVQERMEQISRMYPHEISKSKRNVVTFEAARQVADLVGSNRKSVERVIRATLDRRKGEGINVKGLGMMESMLAARDVMVSEIRKLDGLAELAERGEVTDLARFRHQLEFVAQLQRQVKGAQTEYARTLAGFNISARAGSADPHLAAQATARTNQDYTALLDEYGGAESVQEMAKKYRKLPDPAQRAGFVRGLSITRKIGNAIYGVWQHALLTNPISQTKNIVSGVYTTFIAPNLELGGAVALGSVRRGITGAEDGAKLTQLQAQVFGQIVSIREAFMASGRALGKGGWRGYTPSKIEGSEEFALGGKPGQQRVPALSGEAFGIMGPWGTAIDVLGNLPMLGRVGFRTLEAGDTFFKVVSRRGELYANALLEAEARGKQGDDLVDFISEYLADPPAETLEKMDRVALYNTLQTELDEVGKAVNKLAKLPILRYFIPFVKTPYDAAKYSFVDRSPLGLRWGNTGAMMRAGGAQRDEALARVALGSAVGATVLTMVMTGEVTGGGPANPGLRQARMQQGWQPYSIKVGGRWFSYQGFEPLSSIIGVWADATEIISATEWDEWGTDELTITDVLGAAIGATLYNVSNKTFMQGFASLAQVIQDPRRYSGQTMTKFGKTVVPRGLVNLKRTGLDLPFIEDYEPDPVIRDARTFLDNLKAQMPGFSTTLNPALDEWGEDKVRGVAGVDGARNLALGPDRLSPIYLRDEVTSEVDAERNRLGGIYLNNRSAEFSIQGLRTPIKLPPDWHYKRNQMRGRIAKKNLEKLMKTSDWKELKKMSEAGNEEVTNRMRQKIQTVYNNALGEANAKLLSDPIMGPALQDFILKRDQEQREADMIGTQP